MSEDVAVLLSTLGAATIAGIVTFITTRRTSKGTVQTSEASDLWKEANEIRQWLTAEVSALRAEVEVLRRNKVENEALIRQKETRILILESKLRELGVADE